MLGKLLKYELKHSARYVAGVYPCAGVTAAFMFLAMLLKNEGLSVIGSLILEIVGVAAIVVTLVAVIKNFAETLYGKQGYLSFTLPVKCSTMLISKIIVSFFWIIMSAILMAVILFIILLGARIQSDGMFDTVIDAIKSSGILDGVMSVGVLVKILIIFAVDGLLNILVFVGFVYFAITMANTRALQKHPTPFGFVIFFVTYGIANSISSLLKEYVPLSLQVSAESIGFTLQTADGAFGAISIVGTVFMALVSVGLLVATGWIMEHKVNVK